MKRKTDAYEILDSISSAGTTPTAPEICDSQNGSSKKRQRSANAVTTAGLSNKDFKQVLIPPGDIRRKYSQIFADAFNDCDKSGLLELLRRYSTEDVYCVYKYIGNKCPYGNNYFLELAGAEVIANFWDIAFCSIPDSIYELHETKIRILPNGCSAIVAKFIFTGTKVCKMSLDDHHTVVYSSDGKMRTSGEDEIQPTKVDVIHQKPEQMLVDSVLKASTAVSAVGTVTYFTNPEHRIYKYAFVYTSWE